ncbi:MAG: IS4 family transposase [Syntrophaceae bacterium]|nr:IS4 family transposase [Syntrophaceae bacterium]
MTTRVHHEKTVPSRKKPIREEDIQGFKYLDSFFKILHRLHDVRNNHNREFHYDQYIALILLYFFTPVLTSLRGIQQATTLEKIQKRLGIKETNLTSLSEAQVFDAKLLHPVLKELANQALPHEKEADLKKIQQQIKAVDGTLLPALPKMLWALWQDEQHRAAKLHLEMDIFNHVPTAYVITEGNGNEKKMLRTMLAPDTMYLIDAGYAEYKLLNDIIAVKSSFVIRLKDNADYVVLEEKPLTEKDRAEGIQKDLRVRLGSRSKQADCPHDLRIIEIFHKGNENEHRKSRVSSKKTFRTKETDYTLLLATDRLDLPAETIALLFTRRWQIELFFRWFKHVLGFNHLLALSENGLTIQVYCALIASMLITIWTGRKPTKRTFEMISLHFMGWASDEELARHIEKLKASEVTLKAND